MSNSKIYTIISFVFIYVIWGSTYLLNKIVVSEISPLYLSSLRFLIAGILIIIISVFLKRSLRITIKQLKNSFIAGFLFLVYGNGVFVWGLKYVDSGFAALLASTQPLFILLLMRLIDRKKMQLKSVIGVSLGVFGMYLLVSQELVTSKSASFIGIVIILTCVLSWSLGSLFVSKVDLPKDYFVSTGYQMLTAGLTLLFSSFCIGEIWKSPLAWTIPSQWSFLLLVFFGSIAAFTAFNYLLKNVSPEKVSSFAYVNPVVAMVLGWYVLDEQISTQSVVASLILLTGVYFINSRKRID